jgi:hypothetical protein
MSVTAGPTIEGPASDWLRERINLFCDFLGSDPWGSEPPGRIVIAPRYPDAL